MKQPELKRLGQKCFIKKKKPNIVKMVYKTAPGIYFAFTPPGTKATSAQKVRFRSVFLAGGGW